MESYYFEVVGLKIYGGLKSLEFIFNKVEFFKEKYL